MAIKKIFKNKKAIYFSMISLLLLLILILSAKQSPYVVDSQTQKFYEKRILLTTNQIDSFRNGFLKSALEFSTYSSLKGIAEYRIRLGKNYNSKTELENDLRQAILTGNITSCVYIGTGKNCFEDPLNKVSGYKYDFGLIKLLNNYSKLIYDAYKINFSFPQNVNDYEIKVYQDEKTGPFYVGLNITFSYNVTAGKDFNGNTIADWNITETIPIIVSIEGIKDPYMSITSGRKYNYTFKKFFTEKWNKDVFKIFVDSQSYTYNNNSLSFLGRFYNSEEYKDCCGITTTINKTKYNLYHCGNTGDITNRSFVDCEYFDYTQTGITCRNKDDVLVYNITDISSDDFPFTITATKAKEFNITNEYLQSIDPSLYVNANCQVFTPTPQCGNNICEDNEPDENSEYYCPEDCVNYVPGCGNGVTESGETCDILDGGKNTTGCIDSNNYKGYNYCKSDCSGYDNICHTYEYCGDTIKNGNEECDYKDSSDSIPDLSCNAPYSSSCDYCANDCTIKTNVSSETCGNGIVDGPEVCDINDPNTKTQSCTVNGYSGTQSCSSNCLSYEACTTTESCGDGIVNGPEQCEYTDGTADGYPDLDCNAPYGGSCQYCDSNCKIQTKTGPYCGDGIVNGNEYCDNAINNDYMVVSGWWGMPDEDPIDNGCSKGIHYTGYCCTKNFDSANTEGCHLYDCSFSKCNNKDYEANEIKYS